ncbi:hypothetical protein [Desulfoplanes sp.]
MTNEYMGPCSAFSRDAWKSSAKGIRTGVHPRLFCLRCYGPLKTVRE